MRIRTKVVSGLFLSIALLCLALVALIQTVVVESFKEVELARYQRNVERVNNALTNQFESLHRKVVDWAKWDNTYEFMAKRDPVYIDENLNFLTLSALGYRDVLYFRADAELVHSAHVINSDQKVEASPNSVVASLRQIVREGLKANRQDGSGLAQMNGEIVIYAYTEVEPTNRDAEGRGFLLVTTLVNDTLFSEWAHQTNLRLSFWRTSQETLPARTSIALRALSGGEKFVQQLGEDGGSTVLGLIRDSGGQPALLFQFEDDNVVMQLAGRVRNVSLSAVAIAGVVVLLLTWWLIDRQVLRRLSTLSRTVREIADTSDSHLRLSDPESYQRSLQLRIIFTVSLCFVTMGLSLWLMFDSTLTRAFEEVEAKNLSDNLTRAERALHARSQELLGKTADWGQWDATYEFARTLDKEYIDTNLSYDTLVPFRAKAAVYFSPDGELLYGLEVDQHNASTAKLSPEITEMLRKGLPSIRNGSSLELQAGVLKERAGVFMVTRSPILDSDRSKPSRGSFVFVMAVDQPLVDELSKQTRLDLAIYPLEHGDSVGRLVEVIDDQTIVGRSVVQGLDQQPSALLQVMLKRHVHIQGLAARRTLLLSLAIISLAATALAVFVVHKVIISTLKASVDQVRKISLTGDTSQRISVTAHDELGVLAQQINSMLDSLARTQEELQKARDDAEAANEAKSTFIAKVSHELRTPIHGVVGMLRILMKEETSKTKRSYIAMAKDSAFSLLDTINEILDFSKMENGNLSLERIEFRLRDVVRDALRTVAPRAEEKGTLEIVCDVMPGVPDLFLGDPLRLKQCLINLLGNSIKFTLQGFVKLTVRSEGREGDDHKIILSVADSGVGIPADRLPHIFDPFTQADDSVARVFTGTGLGLTIVKQLVEQMNGGVEVTSEVNKGTEFTMTVRLSEKEDPNWQEPAIAIYPRRAAIIDGDSCAVKVMHESFQRYGVESLIINSADSSTVSNLTSNLKDYGLLIVTSDAIKRSRVFNLVVDIAARKILPLAVIVPTSDIATRERLTALGVPHVLVRPISLEDVLLVLSGQLVIDEENWSNDEQTSLVASRRLKILIADDAETNRIILSSMLQEGGHEVTCVENGLDLLASLKRQIEGHSSTDAFDMVLTDIQMPLMDGLTATQTIRKLERASGQETHIPIIAITAHAMSDEMERMRSCGVDDIVTKPIQPSELARVLMEYGGTTCSYQKAVAGPQYEAASSSPDELEQSAEVTFLRTTAYHAWRQLKAKMDASDFKVADDEASFTRIFDVADVFMRSGESVRRTMLILRAFDSSFRGPLAELTNAKSERNLEGLKSAAHALKGLLLDSGAAISGELASSIESQCKEGRFDDAAADVTPLVNQVLSVASLVTKMSESIEEHGSAARPVSKNGMLN
jgi:signal transduction histidine kinase/CheY-like chemotaxis protein